jgi:hypothetical protein
MSSLASFRARLQRLEKQHAEREGGEVERQIQQLLAELPIATLVAVRDEDERVLALLEGMADEGLSERDLLLEALRRLAQLEFGKTSPRRLQ